MVTALITLYIYILEKINTVHDIKCNIRYSYLFAEMSKRKTRRKYVELIIINYYNHMFLIKEMIDGSRGNALKLSMF